MTRGALENISQFHFDLCRGGGERSRNRPLKAKANCLITLLTDIGANASAEEAEEGLDDSAKQVIDIVDGFRLNFLGDEESGKRAFTTKKEYQTQLKGRFLIKISILKRIRPLPFLSIIVSS